MKKSEALYLSAREASAELAISPATLYAYVSRGLIRSEPSPDSRSHRYRAEDIRGLKERRVPSPEPRGFKQFRSGPAGDGLGDRDHHRGRRDLSRRKLRRSRRERHAGAYRDAVVGRHRRRSVCTGQLPEVSDEMRAIAEAARRAAPIDRAIAVLALAASADPRAFTRAPDGRAMVGARILRLLVATMLNTRAVGRAAASADRAAPGRPTTSTRADLIRRALVLLADHELNASTFTVRCAASTGLNLYDAVIAGLAALKGPKHGGAGVLASQLVKMLIDHDVEPVIRERVALGERFAGFGHGVYKRGDPRAKSLLDALTRAGAPRKFTREVPERIAEATGEFVNIDYALAVLVHACGCRGQRTRAVCDGAQRRLDRACQRATAARQADPAARALCRPRAGAGAGRDERSQPLAILAPGFAGSIAPPPWRRRMVQTASARIRAPPITAASSRCLACPLMRQPDIVVQRGNSEHAGQHMRRRPEQDRRDVDGIEPQRPHGERAGRDGHEGADRRHEAGEKHRQRAPAVEERLALRDHARIVGQRPGTEDFALGAVADQNADPSPSRAPAIAAGSTHSSLNSPLGISALSARMMVEPGITEPTIGTASSRAARNSVR